MKLFHFSIISIFLSISFSQINTELMRNDHQTIGINHNLELDFSYFSGNSRIIQVIGSYRINYILKYKWYGFVDAQYDRSFEKDKEDFSNKAFIHFRIAKPLIKNTDIEGFLQKETNHFINLKNRELIGGGLRINQFNNFYHGIGLMYEIEQYDDNFKHYKFLKSTNYINYKKRILDIIDLHNVIYYQFKIKELENYRLLWDSNFILHASEKITFHINLHYRFDTNGENYFELSNGLGLTF